MMSLITHLLKFDSLFCTTRRFLSGRSPNQVKKRVHGRDDPVLGAGSEFLPDRFVAGFDDQHAKDADNGGYNCSREIIDHCSGAHSTARLGIQLRQTC